MRNFTYQLKVCESFSTKVVIFIFNIHKHAIVRRSQVDYFVQLHMQWHTWVLVLYLNPCLYGTISTHNTDTICLTRGHVSFCHHFTSVLCSSSVSLCSILMQICSTSRTKRDRGDPCEREIHICSNEGDIPPGNASEESKWEIRQI